MSVPKNLTDAINSQPARVILVGLQATRTSIREVPYVDIYRGSTGIRETPAERLQRTAEADDGLAAEAS